MKIFKKHWFKIVSIVVLIILGIYVLSVAIKKATNYEIYTKPKIETKIYTVWHAETFEGGGKSRINYLKDVAKQIEKTTPGVLFMIKQIEPDKLASELNNSTPEILSFGFGLGAVVSNHLLELDNSFELRDELIISGSFNGKLYCLPYIVSGYAMITHGALTDNFHCGTNNYTKPNNIYNTMDLTPAEQESQYEAYKDFVYNNKVTLLGTGRDVYRVNNLNNIGRTTAIITPNSEYTDLIQYLGITKKDEVIDQFLNLSLSQQQQAKLVDYSLFSARYDKLYFSGLYGEMEDSIYKCKIAKVFYD